MADQAHARTAASVDDENAEWRPYQVWASRMRSDDRGPQTAKQALSGKANEGWDPFQVWKRHVQQANTNNPESDR